MKLRSPAFLLLLAAAGCGPAADLWWTPDQQGRRLFERGENAAAAERFEDPMWKGVAFYRAGDLERAAEWLGHVTTPEAAFNLGHAYARLGRYPEALAAYDEALAARPEWAEARADRELVAAIIAAEAEPADDEEPPAGGDPTFDADEVRFDDKGKKGSRGEVEMSKLSDEQLAEMWMRRLQATPADFLRFRFALEAAEAEEESR